MIQPNAVLAAGVRDAARGIGVALPVAGSVLVADRVMSLTQQVEHSARPRAPAALPTRLLVTSGERGERRRFVQPGVVRRKGDIRP